MRGGVKAFWNSHTGPDTRRAAGMLKCGPSAEYSGYFVSRASSCDGPILLSSGDRYGKISVRFGVVQVVPFTFCAYREGSSIRRIITPQDGERFRPRLDPPDMLASIGHALTSPREDMTRSELLVGMARLSRRAMELELRTCSQWSDGGHFRCSWRLFSTGRRIPGFVVLHRESYSSEHFI